MHKCERENQIKGGGRKRVPDGQEVRGWWEVRIREVEQTLNYETCLYQNSWPNLWGDPGIIFRKVSRGTRVRKVRA